MVNPTKRVISCKETGGWVEFQVKMGKLAPWTEWVRPQNITRIKFRGPTSSEFDQTDVYEWEIHFVGGPHLDLEVASSNQNEFLSFIEHPPHP